VDDFGPNDVDLATTLYRAVKEPGARAVLDFLIDHPDERFEGAAIADTLGLAHHRDVARATYTYGEAARSLGRRRPWTEAQLGYLMPAAHADLFRRARETASGVGRNPDA
jgi:hypothetical protein